MGAALLSVLKDGETLKQVSLEGEMELGRSEDCVIRLEDRAVSRKHAVLRPVADGFQIEKRSAFGPILVNGAEATSAVVKMGDVVSIGPYLLKLAAAAHSQQPATTEAAPPIAQAASSVSALMEPLAPAADSEPIALDASPSEDPAAAVGMDLGAPDGLEEAAVPVEEAHALEGALEVPAPAETALPNDLGLTPAEPFEEADGDAATKVGVAEGVEVKLVFQPGAANVAEIALDRDEISIGRGQDCDVVLNDKKASRKHALVLRAGLQFVLKDLDSANGTYVNGKKVSEVELSGEDVIRIGAAEFKFQAKSAAFDAQAAHFLQVPEEPQAEELPDIAAAMGQNPADQPQGMDGVVQNMGMVPMGDPNSQQPVPTPMQPGIDPLSQQAAFAPNANNAFVGIPGLMPGMPAASNGKMTLMERYKALPKNKRLLYLFAGVTLIWFLTDDEPAPAPKPKPKAAVTAPTGPQGPGSFEALSPEQKRFVETQHQLAFEHYRNKDYDKALYEIQKIFPLVTDYKDSREIERYAREGKRKLEAIEEEKKRKEEEERLKARVAQLMGDAKQRMQQKQYEQAQELFSEILAIDPDNTQVAEWRKEIEEFTEKQRLDRQAKEVQAEINKVGWETYRTGAALKKAGRFHSALAQFNRVEELGADDKKLLDLVRKMAAACRASIRSLREPVLAQAKEAETAGDFATAYKLYKKATRIDPPHPEGYKGIARVKGILHEKAKVLYTEGVMHESFSDFSTAQKKFEDCIDVAPEDDEYNAMAKRRLAKYFYRGAERGVAGEGGGGQ